MMTSLYSEPIPVTEITSDWRKYHFPRDSRVIKCVNLKLASVSTVPSAAVELHSRPHSRAAEVLQKSGATFHFGTMYQVSSILKILIQR